MGDSYDRTRTMGRADGNARGKHGVGSSLPVPPSDYKIHLPADQYLHVGAPTEWWWHVGTLKADDRIFGFEINAAGYPAFTPVAKYAFTQVMLTDVSNVRHYQQTTPYLPPHVDLSTWAESDPTKDWYASSGSRPISPTSRWTRREPIPPGTWQSAPAWSMARPKSIST